MRKFLRKMTPWIIGALTAAVLMAGLASTAGIRYENSDDMLFVKGFMGFEGGEPVSFTLYTHTFLAWILCALSKAAPLVPWFSVCQLGLIWLSMTVLVKGSIRLAGWKGYVGSVLYLGVFAAFAACRLSYTTTAALAGAAAVMQLVEMEKTETRFWGIFWAAVLFLGAYSLRQMVALPVLAYCLLALVWRGVKRWTEKQPLRPVAVTAIVLCGLLALFAGVREWEITARGQRETLRWQQSRIELFDYTGFEQDITPALKADSGLTDAQVRLVQQWHFWDGDVDAEAFQTLQQAYANEAKDSVWKKLGDFFAANPRYVCAVIFLGLLTAWIAAGDEGYRLRTLAAALALLGGFVMLLYLCWRGRVLFRGLDTVFFPCGAILLALALDVSPAKKMAALLCAALLAVTGADALLTLDVLDAKPDWISQQREAELEAFALQNPDKLIVRTPNLLRDTRIWPDVSSGLPVNTAIWGDWYCRMPGWHAQLKRYGLNNDHFALADWTNDALLFATNEEAPPDVLLNAVSEALGREAQYELFGEEGTLRFFRLR